MCLFGGYYMNCVCSTCKNLKSIIDDADEANQSIIETCEFDFPSEACYECELDGCELTCEHYESDILEDAFIMTTCKKCGQDIRLMARTMDHSEQYCVSCYLNKA